MARMACVRAICIARRSSRLVIGSDRCVCVSVSVGVHRRQRGSATRLQKAFSSISRASKEQDHGAGEGRREAGRGGGGREGAPSVSVSLYLCLTPSYDHAHRACSAAIHVVSGMYATGAQQYSSICKCLKLIGYVYRLKQAGGLWLPLPNTPPPPRFFTVTPRGLTLPPPLLPSSHPPPSPPRVRVPALHLSRCQPRRTNEPRTAPHKRGSVFRV
jgi:hypothetical protein